MIWQRFGSMPFSVELDITGTDELARRPAAWRAARGWRQMPELGHTQIRDGDEVGGSSETSGSALGLSFGKSIYNDSCHVR